MARNILNPKQIILQTLTLSDFKGNKESYAEEFLQLCQIEILDRLFDKIATEEQEKITEELKNVKTQEEFQDVLENYFEANELYTIFNQVTQELFGNILKKVIPTLTDAQKSSLKEYFTDLAQSDLSDL